jgi:hypothetical protein
MSTHLKNCAYHLGKTIRVIATSPGTPVERLLAGAVHFNAVYDGPNSPEELHKKFGDIQTALVKHGDYATTLAAMSEEDARRLIGELCDLYEEIGLMLRA